MTGHIIQLPGDRHREIQSLLPWYLAGGLDDSDQVRVKAHLSECAECQAEFQREQRLAEAVAALPVDAVAPDVEQGWRLISRRIEEEAQRRSPLAAWTERLFARRPQADRPRRSEAPWLRLALAAQFCLLLLLGAVLWRTAPPVRYHALGAAPVSAAGNLVVIFRPETPEKELREILRANDARLVGGPTEADAYLLHVPATSRVAALARLRRQAQVVLAEPVDSGGAP